MSQSHPQISDIQELKNMTKSLFEQMRTMINFLTQHTKEFKTFSSNHNMDVMLISETHFIQKSYLNFSKYTVYHTNHLAGTA
jgi:hypothetical protein